jgi:hypothetical protein
MRFAVEVTQIDEDGASGLAVFLATRRGQKGAQEFLIVFLKLSKTRYCRNLPGVLCTTGYFILSLTISFEN